MSHSFSALPKETLNRQTHVWQRLSSREKESIFTKSVLYGEDYYYFLAVVGRKSESIANRLLALVLRTLPLPEWLPLQVVATIVDD